MNPLLLNVLLALTWGLMTTNMSAGNLLVGFGIGYVILLLQQQASERSSYFIKVFQFAGFAAYFIEELVRSSVRVAYDAVTPALMAKPAIVAVPLDMETDVEIAALANVVSLTPGTLSLDVSEDRKYLYVHAMYVEDMEDIRREIKDNMERRLLGLMR